MGKFKAGIGFLDFLVCFFSFTFLETKKTKKQKNKKTKKFAKITTFPPFSLSTFSYHWYADIMSFMTLFYVNIIYSCSNFKILFVH